MTNKGITTLLVSLGMLTLPTVDSIAQTNPAQDKGAALPPSAQSSDDIREKVIRYLQSDIFIIEGYGLKKVHLGQSLEDLIEKIGAPHKSSKASLFGASRKLYYRIDSNTEMLVLLTKSGVSQILFEGNMSSAYSTYGGARFGMSAQELRMIYGNGVAKKNTIRYPRKGISFSFENGRLKVVQIVNKET